MRNQGIEFDIIWNRRVLSSHFQQKWNPQLRALLCCLRLFGRPHRPQLPHRHPEGMIAGDQQSRTIPQTCILELSSQVPQYGVRFSKIVEIISVPNACHRRQMGHRKMQ